MQNKKGNFKMRKLLAGKFIANKCMIRINCKLKIKCGILTIIDPKIKALKLIK